MRTRLDEIVESEHAGPSEGDNIRPLCMRIAELAFRHGVERSNERVREIETVRLRAFDTSAPLGDVQPAPAELSPKDEDSPKAQEKPVDRRKGQRRKEQWWRVSNKPFPAHTFNYGHPAVIYEKHPQPDRRSGNDRRKP